MLKQKARKIEEAAQGKRTFKLLLPATRF